MLIAISFTILPDCPEHYLGDIIHLHPGVAGRSSAAEDVLTVGAAAYYCLGAGQLGLFSPFSGCPHGKVRERHPHAPAITAAPGIIMVSLHLDKLYSRYRLENIPRRS